MRIFLGLIGISALLLLLQSGPHQAARQYQALGQAANQKILLPTMAGPMPADVDPNNHPSIQSIGQGFRRTLITVLFVDTLYQQIIEAQSSIFDPHAGETTVTIAGGTVKISEIEWLWDLLQEEPVLFVQRLDYQFETIRTSSGYSGGRLPYKWKSFNIARAGNPWPQMLHDTSNNRFQGVIIARAIGDADPLQEVSLNEKEESFATILQELQEQLQHTRVPIQRRSIEDVADGIPPFFILVSRNGSILPLFLLIPLMVLLLPFPARWRYRWSLVIGAYFFALAAVVLAEYREIRIHQGILLDTQRSDLERSLAARHLASANLLAVPAQVVIDQVAQQEVLSEPLRRVIYDVAFVSNVPRILPGDQDPLLHNVQGALTSPLAYLRDEAHRIIQEKPLTTTRPQGLGHDIYEMVTLSQGYSDGHLRLQYAYGGQGRYGVGSSGFPVYQAIEVVRLDAQAGAPNQDWWVLLSFRLSPEAAQALSEDAEAVHQIRIPYRVIKNRRGFLSSDHPVPWQSRMVDTARAYLDLATTSWLNNQ